MDRLLRRALVVLPVLAAACGGSASSGEGGGGSTSTATTTATTSATTTTTATTSATTTTTTATGGSVCTSGKSAPDTGNASVTHAPGTACIACHTAQSVGLDSFAAGTVYPTAHEPDLCWGVDGKTDGVTVELTDATGKQASAAVNAAGNFIFAASVGLTMPITAVVRRGGVTRVKTIPVSQGDCNACHTEAGASGAAGRITGP